MQYPISDNEQYNTYVNFQNWLFECALIAISNTFFICIPFNHGY